MADVCVSFYLAFTVCLVLPGISAIYARIDKKMLDVIEERPDRIIKLVDLLNRLQEYETVLSRLDNVKIERYREEVQTYFRKPYWTDKRLHQL